MGIAKNLNVRSDLSHAATMLRRHPLFAGLEEAVLIQIAPSLQERRYSRGATIVQEGDSSDYFFVMVDGRARVYLANEEGREVVLTILSAPEYFGELGCLQSPGECSASITALSEVLLVTIPRQVFAGVLLESPRFCRALIDDFALRIRALTSNVRGYALSDVYGRLVSLFEELSAPRAGGRRRFTERLTQQELANRIGASREMVVKIMRELTLGGFIEVIDRHIEICKPLPASF